MCCLNKADVDVLDHAYLHTEFMHDKKNCTTCIVSTFMLKIYSLSFFQPRELYLPVRKQAMQG